MNRQWGPPPGRRPPWWPEGEPFPPRRWGWRGRRFFIWRIGCAVLAVLGIAAAAGAIVATSVFTATGWGAGPGFHRPPGFVPLLGILVLLLLLFAGFRGLRRMSRPMSSLIEAAERIEAGDYSARVPEWGASDLRSVARAFNSMSARLKTTDEQRRSFLADVTHELRTPLSVIRGQAEAIADGLYPADAAHLAPILDATATLDRLVEDLRTMVLTDAGNLVLHKEPVDFGALLRDIVESFRAQADTARVSLSSEAAENLPMVDLDPARMRSAIGNLVSNAIRHTPSGGSVIVAATTPGGKIVVTVTDTGEGISPELLPHVFERFVRGPGSPGSGLGLAIAHDLITAHGGTLEIESGLGAGTTVRASLPVAQA